MASEVIRSFEPHPTKGIPFGQHVFEFGRCKIRLPASTSTKQIDAIATNIGKKHRHAAPRYEHSKSSVENWYDPAARIKYKWLTPGKWWDRFMSTGAYGFDHSMRKLMWERGYFFETAAAALGWFTADVVDAMSLAAHSERSHGHEWRYHKLRAWLEAQPDLSAGVADDRWVVAVAQQLASGTDYVAGHPVAFFWNRNRPEAECDAHARSMLAVINEWGTTG